MIRIFTLFLFLLLSVVACKKKTEAEKAPEYMTDQVLAPTLKSEAPVIALNKESEELVQDWKEYQDFSELIVQYREITKADALLNSDELEELAEYLKDSVRVEKLDIPSVRMRLNVLHNEAKRLSDMSTIPTITEEEVLAENNNVLDAFAALNIKINNLGKQERINRELARFDDLPEVEDDSLQVQPDTIALSKKGKEKKIVKQLN
ncbi:MAG: hypothetical protein WBV45_13130 [Lutimonas sp.]